MRFSSLNSFYAVKPAWIDVLGFRENLLIWASHLPFFIFRVQNSEHALKITFTSSLNEIATDHLGNALILHAPTPLYDRLHGQIINDDASGFSSNSFIWFMPIHCKKSTVSVNIIHS